MEQQNISLNSEKKPLVQFLIGGVQKAGTTTLHTMLSKHPSLHLPSQKELHFFNRDAFFKNTAVDYKKYHQFFNHHTKGQLCGEATPAYIYNQLAVGRIQEYNPSMKWIIVLRNPVTRAYSHWNMQRSKGIENLGFIEALEAESNRLATLPSDKQPMFAYLNRSRYAHQIAHLLNCFDRTQCLFITSDDLSNCPKYVMNNVTEFIGVDHFNFEQLKHHVGTYQNPLSSDSFDDLSRWFADDIKLTERLTSMSLNNWLTE